MHGLLLLSRLLNMCTQFHKLCERSIGHHYHAEYRSRLRTQTTPSLCILTYFSIAFLCSSLGSSIPPPPPPPFPALDTTSLYMCIDETLAAASTPRRRRRRRRLVVRFDALQSILKLYLPPCQRRSHSSCLLHLMRITVVCNGRVNKGSGHGLRSKITTG